MKERNSERKKEITKERKWKKESKNLPKLDLVSILAYHPILPHPTENTGHVHVSNNRPFISRKGS